MTIPGRFHPLPLKQLLGLILDELSRKGSIFGIPQELFFIPSEHGTLGTEIFGRHIHNPAGVAAGPHTQMAQNIVAAWLMGARYIELKTIQTLDEIEVSKPCIDMQDEGYNCEWSQELTVRESFNEYLHAWIIIHILNRKLEWGDDPGTIFNMSVGYDLKGIMSENVQWFLDMMTECGNEIHVMIMDIEEICPEAVDTVIPSRISDSITLSTMHGCPPYEIESIARYLLSERKLHTFVKLNPTLLGPEELRGILNDRLRFGTIVPDEAFEHDLKYPDALRIIRSLRETAENHWLQFGLKLTNTLESVNNKKVFGSDVTMMYMSGRALHPLSLALARRLQEEFNGDLLLSFSAGADAFNIAPLVSCGFRTVTVCSDLLRPGGYMRLNQYFRELETALRAKKAGDITEFIRKSSGVRDKNAAALTNLKAYSEAVLSDARYHREYIKPPDIKSDRDLNLFDCISAPCRDACATSQDIPDYLWHTSREHFDRAFEVILRTNPFPSVTGMVCDHLCQGKCTRINYDDPLQIREVKRFISSQDEVELKPAPASGLSAAVIGAGPAGLSCAYFLKMAGFDVDVFEARSRAGGMVQYAIPGFRLTDEAVERDIDRITGLGVKIHYDTPVGRETFETLRRDFPYIFAAPGAQLAAPLKIEGADAEGVTDPLEFLFRTRRGEDTFTGKNIVIIGGGNTAMDAARTAHRIAGREGSVTVVYRRTVNEMPSDQGEIREVMKEGITLIELAAPEKIVTDKGRVTGLLCSRMELKGNDHSGRPSPVKIAGSEFMIPCDTVIPAIGQLTDIGFAGDSGLAVADRSCRTAIKGVYTGGDAMRGASTAINAIGDGRKAAEQIMHDAGIEFTIPKPDSARNHSARELIIKRATRIRAKPAAEATAEQRLTFALLTEAPDREAMVSEASRCLWCDEMCSICTTVCPNMANRCYTVTPVSMKLQKALLSEDGTIRFEDDTAFSVTQKYQILNIANFCNECGNCTTFCPTAGAPFRDKPRFYLTTASFNAAEEGYFLSLLKDRKNLIYKHKGSFSTLTEMPGVYIYETDFVRATFDRETFRLKEAKFLTPCVREARFVRAAEMALLIEGAESLLNP
ncbi:MAG: putative selenate reductase subunit YgfK [Bacteroidales bacterium]|nr:putative selenate reductase subunit YgfK [Bacteroidales bacterium]MDT8374438.1 putative selenate reductase subunit YgfK [Bacteroidales bacterium]